MKILYVSTVSSTTNAFLIPHIKMLVEDSHQVDVAFKKTRPLKAELQKLITNFYELNFSRSPAKNNFFELVKQTKKLILEGDYDIVHTHTPIASAVVRLACRNIDKVRVIYTAHGFHFYKGAPIKNWLIYYPVEKYLSKFTDTIVTINFEDYHRIKDKFHSKSIEYIPGIGLDLEKFENVNPEKKKKLKDLGLPPNSFIVLSVGELNKNKNHEVIIRALGKLKKKEIHYIICGAGVLHNKLKTLSKELKVEENVHLLGFRRDILEICKVSDLFVLPSKREGLPVSLMEAMATGLPVVASNIRGNSELIDDKKGGFLCSKDSIEEYVESIENLFLNPDTREKFGKYNLEKIKNYSVENVTFMLRKIYSKYF
ncbi:glycosyltransferase family 4 protein [Aerococcaceae bacterium DSM 111022]|nr:glycosyltransferase family 4 protein [Aerococcaceae bacterium DSM 111022]